MQSGGHCHSRSIVPAGRIWRPRNILEYLPWHAWQLGDILRDCVAAFATSPVVLDCNWRRGMPRNTGDEERLTEDEIARRKLGPRGVPGGPDTSKMTPQQKKNIPETGEFDGHTA